MERLYEVESEDVEYGRAGDSTLLARLYRPRGAEGLRPALVGVHGGAWCHFDRLVDAHVDQALAARGMVVAALDFRQGADRYPSSSRDIRAGIRFLRSHAAALSVDAQQIGIGGGSSGGHLALVAAIRPRSAEFEGTEVIGGGGDVDASVAFAVPLFPVADPLARYRYVLERLRDGGPRRDPMFRPEALAESSRLYFGDEETMERASVPAMLARGGHEALPPVWIAHPELDENVTLPMSEALAAAYRAAGGEARLEVFPGVGHAFTNFGGEAADLCIEKMWDFIRRQVA